MKISFKQNALILGLTMFASTALGQSALEHHVWQDARSFEPISRTASAITGPITLSGNPNFATRGSTMTMTFGNGAKVELTQVGAAWRNWVYDEEDRQTAEIFVMSEDPGELLFGNSLCRDEPSEDPIYAVFFEYSLFDMSPMLSLAVYQSVDLPFDANSDGLCGTFNYDMDP